ncbi:MAG: LysM domain-containing protein [Gammaproteobacteria bacterium]|nr:LysM domain-containing protein [Gammaproteobacteria bacterium]
MRNKLFILLLLVLLPVTGFAEAPAVKADHPDAYTVVKGDTLWDISGRFLEEPWRWPEIWEVNPQIANPHLIYPGDVISLTYRDGRPVLTVDRGAGGPRYVKLSPEARTYPRDRAIPAIPIEAIRPFLSQPLVVEENEMNSWPYVVSSYDEHLIAGPGNTIYIRGLPDDHGERYSIYRPGPAYVLPDDIRRQQRTLTTSTKYSDNVPEGEILGYQALYVGDAVIRRSGDPASGIITTAEREVLVGDRLLPQTDSDGSGDYIPKMPDHEVDGRVVSVIDGVSEIGNNQVVVLSVGAEQGIKTGSVLGVYQTGKVVRDKVAARSGDEMSGRGTYLEYFGLPQAQTELVELPPEFAGVVMVFRTFERVSYALVMDTDRSIHIYDKVANL